LLQGMESRSGSWVSSLGMDIRVEACLGIRIYNEFVNISIS